MMNRTLLTTQALNYIPEKYEQDIEDNPFFKGYPRK